ncbi:hypothetical protein HWV62_25685 [Athelia sp. TMB]|nr:hypothetical protein HWV62_44790 [Athelia sp. TMB]KAF7982782.1 hypothetical protein HWV62_25685 [Athelia sp. TMB]
MVRLLTWALGALAIIPATLAMFNYTDYDNDFLSDPSYILSKDFNVSTAAAQQSIIEWADFLAAQGPWVWVECPYYNIDGDFNPDRLLVNDTGAFEAMSDAVFYNTLAWALTGQSNYSQNAASYIDTWFINPATAQTPNLNYAQMERGPNGQVGTHTGLLDFKQMAKISSAILILRQGKSAAWTSSLDTQFNNWTSYYMDWMQTSPIAYKESIATNNHGTYFYNQLASLQILVGNTTAAVNTTQTYFKEQYLNQIDLTGEQPLEAIRTHPYHYRCYNLAAMIVNARIGEYLGLNFWNTTTIQGATIQTAADFIMANQKLGDPTDGPLSELYPSLAKVAAVYGDPDGKYAAFLKNAEAAYPAEPYFLWNQNFTDSGLAAATPTAGGPPVPGYTGKYASANGAPGKSRTMSLLLASGVLVLSGLFFASF